MMYAGIDSHKNSIQIDKVNNRAKTVLVQRFSTSDSDLNELVQVARGAKCVLEACSTSYPIYDTLKNAGIDVIAADALRLKAVSGLKKTDKVDAHRMALMLKAGIIPQAHLPDIETRTDRDLVKQHISITQQMTAEKNKVHALLLRYRIQPKTENFFTKKKHWVEETPVPENIKPVLEQTLNHIEYLQTQKSSIDSVIEQRARQNKDAILLQTIPGIGWFTALLLAIYIDGIERFNSPEQLVSYAGLCPSVHQSGDKCYLGSITKTGRSEIRWALTQCAWISILKSKKFKKFYMRIRRKKGKNGKNKAITAVARKILVIAYYMLKHKEEFHDNI